MNDKSRIAFFSLVAAMLLVCTSAGRQPPQQQSPDATAFTDRTASMMLQQMGDALRRHSPKKFLDLFDLSQMKGGPLFKQQINTFFFQTESFRFHANLGESSAEGDKATFTVDAEMEAEPRSGGPNSRRSERLTFTAVRTGNIWKFVDVQPRTFFSLP